MTSADFRRAALSLPEAMESAHMDHPDFRVRGKIFATLWPDDDGVVMLRPEQQREFMAENPEVFEPVKGGWGRKGATQVHFELVDNETLRRALTAAWHKAAPKKLVAAFDASQHG